MHERRKPGDGREAGGRFACLGINQIYTGSERVRDQDAQLVHLAASIAKHGLLQPVIVRMNRDIGRYKLVSGFRRLMACRMAGLECVNAVVLDCEEAEAAACYMEEHLTRHEPEFLEDAKMITRIGAERVSGCFALPHSLIEERIELLRLPESVRREIEKNRLSLDQAKPLLGIRDPYRQLEAASIIAQRALGGEQARRLVFGPKAEGEGIRRRRPAAIVADTINRAVEGLRARGIPVHVHMYTQDGGICIRIDVKNEAAQSAQAGKNE